MTGLARELRNSVARHRVYWLRQIQRLVACRRLLLYRLFADERRISDNPWWREQVATPWRGTFTVEPVADRG